MGNKYSAETAIPKLPFCNKAHVSLYFDGKSLSVQNGMDIQVYPAVSGRANENGSFDYSETRQRMSQEGPIPAGHYWIEPSQMWSNHWYKLAPTAAWGSHRITIHAYPGTNTHGRGGFFIHGGTHAGSAGCINLHAGMESFVIKLTQIIQGTPDCHIDLSVRY